MWEHERKLHRAAEHFKQLEAQLHGWEQGNGYTLAVKPHPEPPHYIVRVEIDRPIEDEPFPLVLGDFLQNARAALDFIAGALGDVGAGGVMSERDALATMFPITRSPERFAEIVERRLPTVSHPVRAAIEDLQPYKTGGHLFEFEPLWRLNELARFDRHRFLHIGYAQVGTLRLNDAASRNVVIDMLRVEEGSLEIAIVAGLEEAEIFGGEDSAILATFEAVPADPSEEMHMEWEDPIELVFDPDRMPDTLSLSSDMPILWVLRGIIPDVREVFRSLGPFLPAEPPRW